MDAVIFSFRNQIIKLRNYDESIEQHISPQKKKFEQHIVRGFF